MKHDFQIIRVILPKFIIEYVAKQLQIDGLLFGEYEMTSTNRTYFYHKSQIRSFFGFREAKVEDNNKIIEHLYTYSIQNDLDFEHLKCEAYKHFRELCIEPPTSERIERLVKSAIYTYENKFFKNTFQKLSQNTLSKMDYLINNLAAYEEAEFDCNATENSISLSELRADPGRTGLESVLKEVTKLKTLKQLHLPDDLFKNIPTKILLKYKQRAVSEDLTELRRHPEEIRYTLLAAFFWIRSREITDNLIELLIQIIHRIGVRAERKVDKELLKDFKRVSGKTNLLFQMADLALSNPDGIIKKVLFPIVNENTLKALVKEFKSTGSAYKQKVYTVMRASAGKATPYGVYDVNNKLGFVNVGSSYNTAEFAVSSIKSWWKNIGKEMYPESKQLLINADGGGSNGDRTKLWKIELQKFCSEIGLEVTVCHFPPGTSKWNKIEHQLFSQISINWRGRPLTSFEVIVKLIGSTRTRKGLSVISKLDTNVYEKGIQISDEEMEKINLHRHQFHGDWNYTIKPIL